MATVKTDTVYESNNKIIKRVQISGAEAVAESAIIDTSALVYPSGATGDGYCVLMEAVWSINDGYDNVALSYHDETNDELILQMSGDGAFNATGYGGGTVDVEAATPTEDDYDVNMDVTEDGAENAGSKADITLVFKKRYNR